MPKVGNKDNKYSYNWIKLKYDIHPISNLSYILCSNVKPNNVNSKARNRKIEQKAK